MKSKKNLSLSFKNRTYKKVKAKKRMKRSKKQMQRKKVIRSLLTKRDLKLMERTQNQWATSKWIRQWGTLTRLKTKQLNTTKNR